MAITCLPASPGAATDFCKVTVTGATQNDDTAFDADLYPASPEMRYYLTFEVGGAILGTSYVFGVDENGDHVYPNYVFPSAGSWTIRLNDASDDSSVQTQAVTVS